MEINVNS